MKLITVATLAVPLIYSALAAAQPRETPVAHAPLPPTPVPQAASPQPTAPTPRVTTTAHANEIRPDIEISLSTDGDRRTFSRNRIYVKTGQTVLVTFRNGATAKTAQTHDWVLVRPGHQSQVVSLGVGAGVGSGDPDYEPSVLARTQLIPPGQSSSVLFEAPIRPGDYPYLSTAEGDWPSMQGILVVSAIR